MNKMAKHMVDLAYDARQRLGAGARQMAERNSVQGTAGMLARMLESITRGEEAARAA